jgi:outer membrane murein-binding lipoprotein Lpp
MKASLGLGVSLVVVVAAGASFAWLQRRHAASEHELNARLDAVSRELSALRSELAAVKPDEINAKQREAILKLMMSENLERMRRAEQDRQDRYTRMWLAVVNRAVDNYGLSDEQRKGLIDLVRQSQERIEVFGNQFSELALTADTDAIGNAVEKASREFNAWQLGELTRILGEETARTVNHEGFDFQAYVSRWETSKPPR